MEPAGFLIRLDGCVVLGGFGYKLETGRETTVTFYLDSIAFSAESVLVPDARISYPEIVSIQIDGPGAVTRGGGFIGGGFGVEGALEGIAIAGLLNALTTRTKIHTFIQIISDVGEVFLHYSGLEPGALRMAMSPVFVQLRKLDHGYIASRTARLEALRERGLIDDAELSRLQTELTKVHSPAMTELTNATVWRQCPRCKDRVLDGAHCRCGWL